MLNIQQINKSYEQKLLEATQKLKDAQDREEILLSSFKEVMDKYTSLKTEHVLMYKDATREISSLSGVAQQKIDTLSEIAKEDKIENGKMLATHNYHLQQINNAVNNNDSLTNLGKNIKELQLNIADTNGLFSRINTTIGTQITPLVQSVSSMKNVIYDVKADMARRYDNNTNALYHMKDSFDAFASRRDIIVDMSGVKPQIIFDSVEPKNTELSKEFITEILSQNEKTLAEDRFLSKNTTETYEVEDEHEIETKIVEKEVEDENGNFTTITEEVSTAISEQGEREVITFEHNEDSIKGIMRAAVNSNDLRDFKLKPVEPIIITPVNMNTYVSSTLTGDNIAVQFYRQDLSRVVGITILPDDVKRDAIQKMKRWLGNNVDKDPTKKTGMLQKGLPHVTRGPAVQKALANYNLIAGEQYVKIRKQK